MVHKFIFRMAVLLFVSLLIPSLSFAADTKAPIKPAETTKPA
jgi:hypothetical protein